MSQEDSSAYLKTRGMVDQLLPPIPAKRYFTIGEVSQLCAVKPHVLRYWEQEFTQLRPMKRRGNRRYYQHHEVLLIRKIRELLYDEGFTIQGARMRLSGRQTWSNLQAEAATLARQHQAEVPADLLTDEVDTSAELALSGEHQSTESAATRREALTTLTNSEMRKLHAELQEALKLLTVAS